MLHIHFHIGSETGAVEHRNDGPHVVRIARSQASVASAPALLWRRNESQPCAHCGLVGSLLV